MAMETHPMKYTIKVTNPNVIEHINRWDGVRVTPGGAPDHVVVHSSGRALDNLLTSLVGVTILESTGDVEAPAATPVYAI